MTADPLDARGLPAGYPFKPELEVTPRQARAWLREQPTRTVLIDVRTSPEWHTAHIPGSVHIPLDRLAEHVDTLPLDRAEHIAVLCHHGVRSMKATLFLREKGFDAFSIAGGIDLWARDADPCIPRYERNASGCRIIP